MSDENTPTGDENSPALTESDLEALVDRVVAKRTDPLHEKISSFSAPDLAAFKTDLLGEVGKMFESHNPSGGIDEESFAKRIDGLLTSKLSDFARGKVVRTPGPLGRWLGGA